MILIISGPQGSRKTTIAKQIKKLTDCILHDEFPILIPDEYPEWKERLVVITTHLPSTDYPDWINNFHYEELHTQS